MSKKYKNQSTNNIIRGFTLIELLAVLVVLGIVALIIVPNVVRMINKSKADSAVVSAKAYIEAVKASIIDQTGGKRFNVGYCDVTKKGNLICDNEKEYEVYADNKKPTGKESGWIKASNGYCSFTIDFFFINRIIPCYKRNNQKATDISFLLSNYLLFS